MFLDFMGYSYSQIYYPMNVYQNTGNELSCIVMQQTSYPWNTVPMN